MPLPPELYAIGTIAALMIGCWLWVIVDVRRRR
jgi:hypothetical protein